MKSLGVFLVPLVCFLPYLAIVANKAGIFAWIAKGACIVWAAMLAEPNDPSDFISVMIGIYLLTGIWHVPRTYLHKQLEESLEKRIYRLSSKRKSYLAAKKNDQMTPDHLEYIKCKTNAILRLHRTRAARLSRRVLTAGLFVFFPLSMLILYLGLSKFVGFYSGLLLLPFAYLLAKHVWDLFSCYFHFKRLIADARAAERVNKHCEQKKQHSKQKKLYIDVSDDISAQREKLKTPHQARGVNLITINKGKPQARGVNPEKKP